MSITILVINLEEITGDEVKRFSFQLRLHFISTPFTVIDTEMLPISIPSKLKISRETKSAYA